MKLTTALILTLLATPAFASDSWRPYNGSSQRAGGPAFQFNSETGPNPHGSWTADQLGGVPLYQRGSGQRAGGPANLLRDDNAFVFVGRPLRQARSGQYAGGPGAGAR
jgi:hypothetical protein